MNRLIVAVALCLAFAAGASAQQLKVSTGGPKGTYAQMFRELAAKCSESGAVQLVEVESSGSVENIDRLVGNKVNAAIVQTDVIYLRSKSDDLGGVKTLFTLYPEEIHVIARSAPIKEGGIAGIGSHEVRLETVADLAGRTVAAAGGSVVTARVIQLLGEVSFQIVEMGSTDDALKALADGKVDAALAVGGAPLGSLERLGQGFKLLAINDRLAAKLGSVYVPAKLSYGKMWQSTGIPTMATEAIFVTRDYKTKSFVDALARLRGCLAGHLDELKEETGMHPKWGSVNLANKGKWLWYDLPSATASRR